MVEVGEVVVEVGEGGHVLVHERAEWPGAVADLAGGHELIARPREKSPIASSRIARVSKSTACLPASQWPGVERSGTSFGM